MLTWPVGTTPPATRCAVAGSQRFIKFPAPMFKNARLISSDCDLHFELSDLPDTSAPHVVVETPMDPEYCPSRRAIAAAFEQHHFQLRAVNASQAQLAQALPVSLLGWRFRISSTEGGTAQVTSPWELHPAEVSVP